MNMEKYAGDIHRNGALYKVKAMEKLAKRIEKQTNGGLGAAFITHGYHGKYDIYAMVANTPEYQDREGYVLYDNLLETAVFIAEDNS